MSIGLSSREDDDDDDDDADARARAPLITRWNEDPLNQNPFSPVASARKFSAVFGVVFPYSPISIRPAGSPAMATSKNTVRVIFGPFFFFFASAPFTPRRRRATRSATKTRARPDDGRENVERSIAIAFVGRRGAVED